MPDDSPIDRTLIDRYFRGDCTPQEAVRVREWLADPAHEEVAHRWMSDIWRELDRRPTERTAEPDLDKILGHIRRRTWAPYPDPLAGEADQAAPALSPASGKGRTVRLVWQVAASLLLLLAALGLWYRQDRAGENLRTVATPPPAATGTGKKIKKIILPDGTMVWLNASSTLTYPDRFGSSPTREVVLAGEGFFDVAENEQQPFVVQTAGVQIKVLGTAFNVRSYGSDSLVETTLVRGRVTIQNTTGGPVRQVEMRPNQRAVVARKTGKIAVAEVNPGLYTAWQRGALSFEDEKLEDVLKALERWYDVRIHLEKGASGSCRLTASIDRETLTETLELLRTTVHIAYSVSGKEVYLTGGSCE
jgi:ferric-dicitrate binding protein FerR (iron transport regulator)